MRIEQVRFAPQTVFFTEKFCKRWDMVGITDNTKPALYVGVYNESDIKLINSHVGFKVLMVTHILPSCFDKLNPDNLIIMEGNGMPCDVDKSRYKVKSVNVQMKDYSDFQPTVLGDSVYCYVGDTAQKEYYKHSMAERLKARIKHPIIYGFIDKSKPETLTNQHLIDNLYSKCFVNLQLSTHGGRVGIIEMGYMGRKTILYGTEESIISQIEAESKKIGTLQPSVITDNFFENDWQDLNFWNAL